MLSSSYLAGSFLVDGPGHGLHPKMDCNTYSWRRGRLEDLSIVCSRLSWSNRILMISFRFSSLSIILSCSFSSYSTRSASVSISSTSTTSTCILGGGGGQRKGILVRSPGFLLYPEAESDSAGILSYSGIYFSLCMENSGPWCNRQKAIFRSSNGVKTGRRFQETGPCSLLDFRHPPTR